MSGTVLAHTARWHSERCFDGLKFIVMQGGEITCKLPRFPRQKITGPCVCVVWNRGEHEAMQCITPGAYIQYTTVMLSAATLERQLGLDVEHIRSLLHSSDSEEPQLFVQATPRSVCSLCTQVSTCPLKGMSRNLYLSGKAMEIAALALTSLEPRHQTSDVARLSSRDIEKLHGVKKVLQQRLQNPPSLAELGLVTGLNTRKLTEGFRQVFGTSVFEYLQELRLETAYRMLADGEMSVSSAAYKVGYSAAHLSVAFRRRFGITPKSLRH